MKTTKISQHLIDKGSRGRREILTVLRADWPVSNDIAEKLSVFLSFLAEDAVLPSVVNHIIDQALHAYEHKVFHDRGEKYPDPERISAFLDAILTATANYVSQRPDAPTHAKNLVRLRADLYELLTNDNLKAVLRKSEHEKSILAGNLGHCV